MKKVFVLVVINKKKLFPNDSDPVKTLLSHPLKSHLHSLAINASLKKVLKRK